MGTPVWTNNLSCLPELTIQSVEQWASTDYNIPRAVLIKGYSNWIEGYIHDIEDGLHICPPNNEQDVTASSLARSIEGPGCQSKNGELCECLQAKTTGDKRTATKEATRV
ncbi:hypothetical protein DPEC_G00063150 [Dallia pectoralis]|uniref:Uncharacterized protein n=1 Tax=Dallia pectoralis TaxID=75939 RepID=A0ACC2H7E6_DALPE|nr:hypothetical protein DPEC_G00063150 [Dallia pectoralis]